MNALELSIYKNLLNIVDEETLLAIIHERPIYIRLINNPSEAVQLESVKKNNVSWPFFMKYIYPAIHSYKAINLLHKGAPEQYKAMIKSHPNYKSDAELVLERIK